MPFGILGPSWLILHAAWLAGALQRTCSRMAHNSWHTACGLQAAHQCLLSAKASLESLVIITLNFLEVKREMGVTRVCLLFLY